MSSVEIATLALCLSAISVVLTFFQFARARLYVENAAVRVVSEVAYDVTSLIVERLGIRFDPMRIQSDGLLFRQFRATAALKILGDIKVGDLPPEAVGPFIKFRSGMEALNQATSTEKSDKPLPLQQYKVVFERTLPAYSKLQEVLLNRTSLFARAVDYRPPEKFDELVWESLPPTSMTTDQPKTSV